MEIKYSFWVGLLKNLKNQAVIWIPAVLAFLANVPVKYAWIASVVVYQLKNYYEIKTGKKLL